MGARSRNKGTRGERELARLLSDAGFSAQYARARERLMEHWAEE